MDFLSLPCAKCLYASIRHLSLMTHTCWPGVGHCAFKPALHSVKYEIFFLVVNEVTKLHGHINYQSCKIPSIRYPFQASLMTIHLPSIRNVCPGYTSILGPDPFHLEVVT